ncbi:MAG: hypothetical protein WAL70_05620 [Aeromicrobium sp.]
MVRRSAARGTAIVGMLMMWLLLAPAAEAVPPPSPDVTIPADAEFTVEESAQPIHFEGTVTGPVGAFDRLQISNFTVNPGDPPLRCDFNLGGLTTWSCDAAPVEAIGDYELRVVWTAPDPPFGENSAPTILTLHVVPDGSTTPPEPDPDPTSNPPANNPDPTPSATAAFVAPPPPLIPLEEPPSEPPAETAPEPPAETLPAPAEPPAETAPDDELAAWDPTDHPKQVLGIGIATFTMLTFIGPAGLALSSIAGMAPAALAAGAGAAAATSESDEKKKGSVKAAKVKSAKFSAAGSGTGDQSPTWRTPGWEKTDAWGLAVPLWLATRSPLTARILADGGYLRAMFGSAWALGVFGGLGLGLLAAHDTGGMPIPPGLTLTAILLALAIFDATWGAAGVVGFGIGMMIWRSSELGFAPSVRSFLGLAALWFAIPLIAAASRPFRRSIGEGRKYAWDRIADAVIATLIAGWAVQKTVGGLPGLSGLDLPIAESANTLALVAMAAVIIRVLIEELAAWRYPLRLGAVATGKLPFAGPMQRLFATGLRTFLFVFLAYAFIGNCWQLWVGAALFFVPQVLSIYERSFPNSERLNAILPEGILKVLVMLIVGVFFGRLVFSILDDPDSILRNGFILFSLPGLALSLIGLFGHDGPDRTWTWPRQAIGAVILAVTAGLVLTGW